MKNLLKIILVATILMLSLFCCKKSQTEEEQDDSLPTGQTMRCASHEYLQQKTNSNPALQRRMDSIEAFTQKKLSNINNGKITTFGLNLNKIITIPVIFNLLYNSSEENISHSQIQSQVDVLNEDYSGLNKDYDNSNPFNSMRAGDTKIRFSIALILRKHTSVKSWSVDDKMKTTQYGFTPYRPDQYLNIWICNLGGKTLGYAQFPGDKVETDGVVLDYSVVGRGSTMKAPYNLGRTATHEVGHWLNLYHIWGDTKCGDDKVGDTPKSNAANYGCPKVGHKSTCFEKQIEMTMNYMDYVDDACMYMFSQGQRERVWTLFQLGGTRYNFAQ